MASGRSVAPFLPQYLRIIFLRQAVIAASALVLAACGGVGDFLSRDLPDEDGEYADGTVFGSPEWHERQRQEAAAGGAPQQESAAAAPVPEPVTWPEPFFCPTIGVLSDAASITSFSGAGEDLTDVRFTAEIEAAATLCELDQDDGLLSVDVAYGGEAEIGPAAEQRLVTPRIFVALTERDARVLQKQIYDLPLAFGGPSRRILFEEAIEEIGFTITPELANRPLQILVGFQLTPEQAAYNRRIKAARGF